MLGAIIGDIVGSRFEFNNHRSKNFQLFTSECYVTDDSIMTLAVAKAIMECKGDWEKLDEQSMKYMREIGQHYPNCGYGDRFDYWVFSDDPQPYNSFGNGAAMRVSPCGFAAKSGDEAKLLSHKVTKVTHNHPEGLKGAQATAIAVYMAKNGASIEEIRERINRDYYQLDFTIDEMRPIYTFNETCQRTVPQAIECFLESNSFEDAIRIAISLGGDSDTIGAITGAIAEAYYGVPDDIRITALNYLDNRLLSILDAWAQYCGRYEQ